MPRQCACGRQEPRGWSLRVAASCVRPGSDDGPLGGRQIWRRPSGTPGCAKCGRSKRGCKDGGGGPRIDWVGASRQTDSAAGRGTITTARRRRERLRRFRQASRASGRARRGGRVLEQKLFGPVVTLNRHASRRKSKCRSACLVHGSVEAWGGGIGCIEPQQLVTLDPPNPVPYSGVVRDAWPGEAESRGAGGGRGVERRLSSLVALCAAGDVVRVQLRAPRGVG
jgi:hypothetical protein